MKIRAGIYCMSEVLIIYLKSDSTVIWGMVYCLLNRVSAFWSFWY